MDDYPIVEIEWFDAQTSTNSMFIEDIQRELKPIYSMSIGYLIHKTKDFVVLSFLNFGDGLTKHHQVIPKKMIRKTNVIRKKK